MLIHKSFETIVNMLALFWLAWTVTIQSGANRNGALWSLTSMCTVNITKQHILYKCMKLDKAVFTWQGRRNHGGQGGHCDPLISPIFGPGRSKTLLFYNTAYQIFWPSVVLLADRHWQRELNVRFWISRLGVFLSHVCKPTLGRYKKSSLVL